MRLTIIIPVYNEEKTILRVLENVIQIKIPDVEKEIVIIDDGSTDNSKLKIQSYSAAQDKNAKFKDLKVFYHEKNMGKGRAVQTGIKKATGDYIVIQDADLEYDPKDIKKLLQPILRHETQVVYGTRLKRLPNLTRDERQLIFLLHYFGNRFLSLIVSILYGQWLTDMETCYKIFPRSFAAQIKLSAKGFEFEPEITAKLLKYGYKIKEIPISTNPRGYEDGKKLNAFKEGPKALWVLLKYRFID